MYAKDLTPFQSVARTETNQHTLVSLTTDGSLPEIPHLKNWWLLLEEMQCRKFSIAELPINQGL